MTRVSTASRTCAVYDPPDAPVRWTRVMRPYRCALVVWKRPGGIWKGAGGRHWVVVSHGGFRARSVAEATRRFTLKFVPEYTDGHGVWIGSGCYEWVTVHVLSPGSHGSVVDSRPRLAGPYTLFLEACERWKQEDTGARS